MGEIFQPILEDPTFVLAKQLCTLFFVVFSIAIVFWTWRDATKRSAMAWFWALVVLLFNLAGWAVYMVMRPPEYAEDARERRLEIRAKELSLKREAPMCPACLKPVDKEYLICPHCMKTLKKACVECERPLEMHWVVCPYCKARQTGDRERAVPGRATSKKTTSSRKSKTAQTEQ